MQQKPKGTRDFLPDETFKLQILESLIQQTVETSCYREIRTPIFEHSDVFVRSSGDSSDIVNKEMYSFLDRGNRSLSLRPEGTAGVIRALVENKAYANVDLPLRYYYLGPSFRYERPQAGRFRQFQQLGVESIGVRSPYLDAEVILLAIDVLNSVGVNDLKLKINSIGDSTSRDKYKKALQDYFKPYLDKLCEDCQVRYEKNPLRILDCKIDGDKDYMQNCPNIGDYLSQESKDYFKKVLEILDGLEIDYEIDNKLVRGLDYYNDTVFEIYVKAPSGTDYGAIIAGGRYDQLVEQFGGPDMPAFGFGLGLDRLLALCEELEVFKPYQDSITAYIMPLEKSAFPYAFYIANYLRLNGVDAEIDYQMRSIKSQFKSVERKNATLALLVGSTEHASQSVTVKINATKEQKIMPLDQLLDFILGLQDKHCDCKEHEHDEHCGCTKHEHDEHCECKEHKHDEHCSKQSHDKKGTCAKHKEEK